MSMAYPRFELAKLDFYQFIGRLLEQVSEFDHHLLGLNPADCVFELRRQTWEGEPMDNRLYKTHFGAFLAVGGRHSEYAGYYLHVKPGECYIGGGMYKPSEPVLKKIRQEIEVQPRVVKEILGYPPFVQLFGGLQNDMMPTAPVGYPKDHPLIDLLQQNSFFVKHPVDDALLMAPLALDYTLSVIKEIFPLNRFLNETFVS